MKKIQVIMSMFVLLVMFVACGNNEKPVAFNNLTTRDLRPDCVFTVEEIKSIPNTDMNLVTLSLSFPYDKVNALCPKNKKLVTGQEVTVIMVYYLQHSTMKKSVVIIQ